MTAITFDFLAYRKALMDCGVPEKQAEGFAELARKQNDAHAAREAAARAALKAEITEDVQTKLQAGLSARDKLNESERDKLATKEDVANVRLEIEKVRLEIEKVRNETEKLRGEMNTAIGQVRKEVEKTKSHLLYWVIGLAVTGFGGLAGMIAKAHGWINF